MDCYLTHAFHNSSVPSDLSMVILGPDAIRPLLINKSPFFMPMSVERSLTLNLKSVCAYKKKKEIVILAKAKDKSQKVKVICLE